VSRRNPGIFAEIEMDLESSMLSADTRTPEVDRALQGEGGSIEPVSEPVPAIAALGVEAVPAGAQAG
jgi:hypothetical protein